MAPLTLRIDGATFRDPHNREVTLHGINVAGDSKFPAHPDVPSHVKEHFFDADKASFVGRPFTVEKAHEHLSRLRRWGYNTIRYIFTWEAIEHAGPGIYDEEYIQHTIEILRVMKKYGFYVFMDPHQDVWSRFTGGSGAPLWTVYACGFDPTKLAATEASVVQNTWQDPLKFPKMIWATNYYRLAVQTIFTFFYAGRDFAPKCIIDGKNIQDYLQEHMVNACKHLAHRIHEAGDLHDQCVIGYETINEPNKGYVGHPDLAKIPDDQKLRKYTCPTGFQAMLTGSGRPVEIEIWDFGGFGPYKSGSKLIDPKGTTAWLDPASWDDSKYGWKRSSDWKLGECVWAQHKVWDPKTGTLLLPYYFAKHPKTGQKLDQEYWTNHNYMEFYRKYRDAIRSVWNESFLLMQPQPFEIPPHVKGTPDGDDPRMIFASHFYDGITLITKRWNKTWNVDVLGMLRGRYSSPAFAVKIGETAIRNCFKDQLSKIRQEGIDNMGIHPCLYTEVGIPYDMDDQRAYKTGDYSSQAAAIDANYYAIEGSLAQGATWWVYTATNTHQYGDHWNGEDLSLYSTDDSQLPPPIYAHTEAIQTSLDSNNPSYSASRSESDGPVTPESLNKTLSVDAMTNQPQVWVGAPGYRAAEAYCRPTAVYTHGTVESYGFDLRRCTFHLNLNAPSSTPSDHPTVIFLPDYHFPQTGNRTSVAVTGGKWEIKLEEEAEGAQQQVLRWWHGEGDQRITVKGVIRRRGQISDEEPETHEEGYLEQYWKMGKRCSLM